MITATGLGSGLDISSLVSQLVAADRAGSDLQLTRDTNKLNTKLSAFGSLKSAVSVLQNSLAGLSVPASFAKRSATSSNSAAITATASNNAVANTYSLEVTTLAKAHALASPAFAETTEAIGTGTLTFRFGTTVYDADTDVYSSFTLNPDRNITTLTIDSTNNTLDGIMTAINTANFGVKASIVNDGSGNRLLLGSEQTGAQNSIEISVSDTDGNDTDGAGLSAFAFNQQATNSTQTAAADNATFSVNGLTIQSQANTVTTAIPGLSLALKETTTAPVSVAVQADTSSAVSAFNTFIGSYNQFRAALNSLTGYNAETKAAGALLGDFTVRSVVSQVENILRNEVAGVAGSWTSLADLGLKTNANGSYVLDTEKFKAALVAEPQTIASLFAALGAPTDSEVSYQASTTATLAGSYAVNVTTAATASSHAGAGVLPDFALGGELVIDADNDNLTLTVDGVEVGEITLTHGTYTAGADLANELQARINGAATMVAAGKTVAVSYAAGSNNLVIGSGTFGNSSQVNITAVDTQSATSLGFSVADGTAGTDVAGTINGAAAQGAGKLLTATDATDAEGLSLLVSGTATGARGTVNFTRGVADQLNQLLDRILDTEGSLAARIDSIKDRQEAVEARRARLELKWKAVETRYLTQFNALDGLLSKLQSTSSYLESQLGSLPKPVSSRSS
jgi:flagellar hook-associated protein 2